MQIKNIIEGLKNILERLDNYRNEFLYFFIKPYWPRAITPNQVTWIRVFIGVGLFVMLFFFKYENKALVVWLFVAGALTDLIDGPVARGTNRVTEFGAALDSTADRILILPIAVYSLFEYHKWLLLALLLAEVINALASIFYRSKAIYMESNIFGKTKMVLMSVVFIVILFVWPYAPHQFFIYMLWATLPISFLSIFAKVMELNQAGHINNKIISKQLDKYD